MASMDASWHTARQVSRQVFECESQHSCRVGDAIEYPKGVQSADHAACKRLMHFVKRCSRSSPPIIFKIGWRLLQDVELLCPPAGCGKTHTLVGDLSSSADAGLLTRSLGELARGIGRVEDGSTFHMRAPVCGLPTSDA